MWDVLARCVYISGGGRADLSLLGAVWLVRAAAAAECGHSKTAREFYLMHKKSLSFLSQCYLDKAPVETI